MKLVLIPESGEPQEFFVVHTKSSRDLLIPAAEKGRGRCGTPPARPTCDAYRVDEAKRVIRWRTLKSHVATTSVKLSVQAKERLDRLQARLVLLGYRFTKAKLLELLIDAGSEKPVAIIERAMGARFPIPEEEIQRIIDSAEDMGPTSWRDIDPLLYGRESR